MTHKRRDGEYLITDTYVFGGVDLSEIPFTELDQAGFQSRERDLGAVVGTAMTRPAADHQGKVWVGAVTGAPAAEVSTAAASKPPAGTRWLWPVAAAFLAVLLFVFLFRRLSGTSRGETLIRLDRAAAVVVLAVIGAAVTFLITRGDQENQPPRAVTAVQIPKPVVVYRPKVEPHTATSAYAPTTTPPPTPPGFTAGTCLTGKIPDVTVPVPANDVTEVPCTSKAAHYKVIKTFRDTSNMAKCDKVRRTQYAYSETLTSNGIPVHEFVYCLIGLGRYAR